MIGYAERNLITLTSRELAKWATHALRGTAEVRFNYGKMYSVYDRTSVLHCGTLVGCGFFIIDRTHFISRLYTAAPRRGTAL